MWEMSRELMVEIISSNQYNDQQKIDVIDLFLKMKVITEHEAKVLKMGIAADK